MESLQEKSGSAYVETEESGRKLVRELRSLGCMNVDDSSQKIRQSSHCWEMRIAAAMVECHAEAIDSI